jgi:hypothetical protein
MVLGLGRFGDHRLEKVGGFLLQRLVEVGQGGVRLRPLGGNRAGEVRLSQAELVGLHGCRRGAVGEQVELALLDPVLHLAAGAVDRFVQMPGLRLHVSEVTTKRGLASPPVTSALPTTRRSRLQLPNVA